MDHERKEHQNNELKGLNSNHPLSEKYFRQRVKRNLVLALMGSAFFIMGFVYNDQFEKESEQYIETLCRREYNISNCKERAPRLYQEIWEDNDNILLVNIPGLAGLLGGAGAFLWGISEAVWLVGKRKLELYRWEKREKSGK